MEAVCTGTELAALWMERYPEIAFLTSFGEEEAQPQDLTSNFGSHLELKEVDVLYLFGVELEAYFSLRSWLHEKNSRMLIFLEDEMAVWAALTRVEASATLITDPQVHLQHLSAVQQLDATLTTLVETFPSVRIEVAALPRYAQEKTRLFQKIRMKLFRQSAVVDALMTDALYSHQLVENVLANFQRWPHSFFANGLKGKFQNIPALICGAGPSLGVSIGALQALEDRALIIAGGSTIAALSNQGIVPHLGVALDPNPEEYTRLRVSSAFEMPFIYGTRVQPGVFQTSNGPFGYLHSYTGGPCEAYFEREFQIEAEPVGPDLGPESFSVTMLCIALAVEMGCNPILFNGIDLAYTGGERYAAGVMPSSRINISEMRGEKRASERLLRRKGIDGTRVYTLVKWIMESSSISAYAAAHPETRFFNVSPQGLGFKKIPNLPLAQAVQEHCQTSYDLRAWIHAEIQKLSLTQVTPAKIQEKKREMHASLERLKRLCEEMLAELASLKYNERPLPTGRMTLLQIEFEEEKAFECFFLHVGLALDRLLNRSHPLRGEGQALREKKIDRLTTKWEHLQKMIQKEVHVIQS